ncbi:hypothetical protein T484DRAFT_1745901 [Baffinella frigidus]|nr:hypothetical protein T484DRAFT_1745901 [Cryptophyta sp. CCMP2293]
MVLHCHSDKDTAAHAHGFDDDALMDSALPALSDLAFEFDVAGFGSGNHQAADDAPEPFEMHLHAARSRRRSSPSPLHRITTLTLDGAPLTLIAKEPTASPHSSYQRTFARTSTTRRILARERAQDDFDRVQPAEPAKSDETG